MLFKSKFRPAWWLRNPHLQTLWAARVQPNPTPETRSERLTTPDGDFLDLNWTTNNEGPIVVIFHGLTGSVHSPYVRSIMHHLSHHNVRAVLMHFRGSSTEPNRTPGSYHSGHTKDIRYVINTVKERYPDIPIAAAGYSLGGNALLKYLAESPDNPLCYAVSVSPPLVLAEGAKRMEKGFSRFYQSTLLKQLKAALRAKHERYPEFELDKLGFEEANSFFEFDDLVTAPLHGFDGVDDYYQRASTLDDLINIKTTTHILWSEDDPFFTKNSIPQAEQLSDDVTFELSTHGGHVAFLSGNIPFAAHNWLRERVGGLLIKQLGKADL